MTIMSWLAARSYKLSPPIHNDVRVARKLAVPMRDGVNLLGDRWYSAGSPDQPMILIRSPYGRGMGFGMVARLFAERGFQVFLQSCRGTSGSGGTFNPVRQEPADGLDTLEWLQAQPWCSGPVFTFGLSYLGFVQWAIARDAGDRIAAMTLHCTLSNYRNEVLAFGGLALEGALGWGAMMSKFTSAGSFLELVLSMRKGIGPKVYEHLPLGDIDTLAAGKQVTWWQDWLNHPEPSDPWWDAIDFTKTLPEIQAPAAMVGGWQDLFLPWQVKDFEAMQACGRDVWLTVGPWHHTAREGAAEALRQGMELFSAHAHGRRPFADRDRVRLYVVKAEEWRDYSAWPPPEARETRFYLRDGSGLSIEHPANACDPTRFVYDPADPTPSLHPPSPFKGGAAKPDMAALEVRNDTVCFTGSPLSADVDVIGPVEVDVHFHSDSQHTDLYACLCDVDPAGLSLKVCDGYLRIRPGDLPEDGDGVRTAVISCAPTAYRFRSGHRLRLIVASGAHPRFARNLGTGEPLATAQRMVRQSQTIFHDRQHPSALRAHIIEV